MAWLNGWKRRIKLTIDSGDIDDVLSDFPILVYLSTSSGRNSADVSAVFDELQNDANRKKIAVTTSDGKTQCYVEIEKWDDANEKAWLWIKVPSVASGTDTDLYLYYDKTKADNTDYVDDPNSVPAETVWGSNCIFISHMRDDPDNEHIRDSSEYDNDGTKGTAGEPTEGTAEVVGGVQDFDGDDHISLGTGTPPASLTIVGWASTTDITHSGALVSWFTVAANRGWKFYIRYAGSDTIIMIEHYEGPSHYRYWNATTPTVLSNNTLYRFAVTQDGETATPVFYLNDTPITPVLSPTNGTPTKTERNWLIGSGDAVVFWEGGISLVRIYDEALSVAWLNASYESEIDDLLAFGSEEQLVGPFPTHLRVT